MGKKTFTGALNSVMREEAPEEQNSDTKKPGRPKTATPGGIRTTLILNKDLMEKIKALAYWERLLIKDVVEEAIEEKIKRYEKQHGEIKPIPKK